MFDLKKFQQEQKEWSDKNFKDKKSYQPLLGAIEEIGELSHAHLKAEQGIRGTEQELVAQAQDAVADVIIYLADYCNMRGFDLEDCLKTTWEKVRKRDWTKNKLNGEEKIVMAVKILINNLKVAEKDGKLKAFASIDIGGKVEIYGCKLMESDNGYWVAYPQRKGKDEKWYDNVRIKDDDIKSAITNAFIEAYNKSLNKGAEVPTDDGGSEF